jgi:hypothetical protein
LVSTISICKKKKEKKKKRKENTEKKEGKISSHHLEVLGIRAD